MTTPMTEGSQKLLKQIVMACQEGTTQSLTVQGKYSPTLRALRSRGFVTYVCDYDGRFGGRGQNPHQVTPTDAGRLAAAAIPTDILLTPEQIATRDRLLASS